MEVKKIIPRGYCFGVINAINAVLEANSSDIPKPINIYGMLIHNKQVVDALTELGINTIYNPTISDFDNIKGTVVFTAHGIQNEIIIEAKKRALHVIDATCRDVLKTKDIIDDHLSKGYQVIYIGKKNHPESIGATGHKDVHLIEDLKDLKLVDLNKKSILTNQTTVSLIDIENIYDYIKSNYPHIKIIDEVCNVTRRRQLAVIANADAELLYVVGDKKSNNSKNLVNLHTNGKLIETITDIDTTSLGNVKSIAVTAGASTPKAVVNEIIHYLEHFNTNTELPKVSHLSNEDILNRK